MSNGGGRAPRPRAWNRLQAADPKRASKRHADARIREAQDRLAEAVASVGGYRALERRASISKSTIEGWLRPHKRGKPWQGPTLASLIALSDATGYSVDYLCGARVPAELTASRRVFSDIAVAELRVALRSHLKLALSDLGIHDLMYRNVLGTGKEILDGLVADYAARARKWYDNHLAEIAIEWSVRDARALQEPGLSAADRRKYIESLAGLAQLHPSVRARLLPPVPTPPGGISSD
jgi:hypothetical protein